MAKYGKLARMPQFRMLKDGITIKILQHIFLTLLLLSFTVPGYAALEKVSLQLKWQHQFQFAGYYMAIEKGFYRDAGLEVELREPTAAMDMVQEVLQGRATYAVGRTDTLIDISEGKQIVYLAAIYQSSPLVLLAAKRPDIKNIRDIKNLRIMLTGDKKIDAVLIAMMLSQGINYRDIHIQKHSYNIDDLVNNKTDLMTSYISNEPFILNSRGIESVIFHPKDYGFDFYNDILFTSRDELNQHPERVKKFREASLRGWEYAFSHIGESIDIILRKYNSQHKSRAAYIYEARELKKLAYFHTDKVGNIEKTTLDKMFEIYRILGLAGNRINLSKYIYNAQNNELQLTEEEKRYLKDKAQITMCVDPDWLPFTKLENGHYSGISADIYKLIRKKLPIPIKIVQTSSWAQTIKLAKQRQCDIIDFAVKTTERSLYLNFTQPFLKVPLVIATRQNVPFIADFKSLKRQKVGIVASYAFVDLLQESYPNINIVEVKSLRDGLQKVKDGELFGYIGTLAGIAHIFKKDFTGELKIAGKFQETWDMGSAVRNDDTMLLTILQKTIRSIEKEKIRRIIDKWISIRYEKEVDYTLTWQVLLFVLLIMLFLVHRQRELKKYTNELEEQKELYNLVFENSLHGVLLLDATSNRFVNCNNQTVRMLKASSKKDVINMLPAELSPAVQPDGRRSDEKSLEMIALCISQHSHTFDWKHIKTTGEEFWVEVVLTYIKLNNREVIHVLWKNIDDQKEVERNLIESREKAIAATRAKSEFLANMSHEIRTPMNGIIGMTHLALETSPSVKQKKFLQIIDQSAKSLLAIINDILDFSKVEAGKLNIEKVNFNLVKLIDDILDQLKFKAAEKDIHFRVDYAADVGNEFYGDDLRISQVITNLTDNAIKFTPSGEVSLKVEKVKADYLRFTIRDSGIGLLPEQQEKLFQSFAQADSSTTRRHGGTGLGLYISKSLVELMNGRIWVESEYGKGSSFSFEIEIEEIQLTEQENAAIKSREQEQHEQKQTLKQQVNHLGGRILLTEDNLINQEIVTNLLEDSNIIIDIAENGLEAINKFKQNEYQLIIMDIQMPVMDGYEATRIIRKDNLTIPIIALTANARHEDLQKTLQAGMNEHLNKPIDVNKLYLILLKYLAAEQTPAVSTEAQADSLPDIPPFTSLDTRLGLSYFSGNSKIYLKILTKFADGYRDLDLKSLDAEQLKRSLHTLRGLSSNIGATELNAIIIKLETTQNEQLLAELAQTLTQVTSEIDTKLEIKSAK